MDLNSVKYVPIIKTTDAELRGYSAVSADCRSRILPIFELTKSRISKNNQIGDINRQMQKLIDVMGAEPFFLDVTTHKDLGNRQITRLLNEKNGFKNWRNFLNEYRDACNILPTIHIGDNLDEVSEQVTFLLREFPFVAYRSNIFDEDSLAYLSHIYAGLGGESSRLVVALDGQYISQESYSDHTTALEESLGMLRRFRRPGLTSVACSSFPKSVTEHPDGYDDEGYFRMEEVFLYIEAKKNYAPDLVYGDYASIHPKRYPTRGGAWVPRIDVPLKRHYLYSRYRRHDGGYIRAAQTLLDHDRRYVSAECWGDEQISLAADNKPQGVSPSFWISVRLNIHVTRKSQGIRVSSA